MKIVGHRGAGGLAPENTIASLEKALKHRVDEIECDVRVTKDNVAVLNHDPAIILENGQRLVIRQHTFAGLKEHRPNLATLTEALATVPESTPLQIEIKSGDLLKPIFDTIQTELTRGRKPASLRIGSKNQKILRAAQQTFPEIEKVVIESWSGIRATYRARQLHTKRLSMNQRWLWTGFIRSMTRRGWQLYAYTVNDPAKAKHWQQAGLTGIFTDYPDQFER